MTAATIISLVELGGGVCELIGAFLMANALLGHTQGADVWKYLGSSFVNGKLARGFKRLSGVAAEDYRLSLRGLAFIVLGFVVKVGVIGWKMAIDAHLFGL